MYDVVSLGELLIDFTPAERSKNQNPVFEQNPGGAPANVLVACNRLGRQGAFIGMVGNDQFGFFLKEILEKNGVNTVGLKFTDKASTTLAFVHLDGKGDRSFSFCRKPGADTLLSVETLDLSIIDPCKVFHFGSVSMTHEPARTATLQAAAYAKSKGRIVSYDPNYRPALWESRDDAIKSMKAGIPFADIVKVSDEELALVSDCADMRQGAACLLEKGITLVCVTLGAKGCYYAHQSAEGYLPTYDTKVMDTTGSGDAFMGALLHGVLKESHSLLELTKAELEDIVDFANAAGAVCATKRGAIPAIPTIEEILQCQRSVQKFLAMKNL